MARVTVEDCVEIIPNRFELVVAAAQRAKQIASGAPLTVDRDNDKDAVVSLREIAGKSVNPEELIEETIVSHTTRSMSDDFQAEYSADEDRSDVAAISADVEEAFDDVAMSADDLEKDIEGHMSFEDMDIED